MIAIDTLKTSVQDLHLTSEQNEKVLDLIENACRLGWENGYDEAKSNFTPIILELMGLAGQNKQIPNPKIADD